MNSGGEVYDNKGNRKPQYDSGLNRNTIAPVYFN